MWWNKNRQLPVNGFNPFKFIFKYGLNTPGVPINRHFQLAPLCHSRNLLSGIYKWIRQLADDTSGDTPCLRRGYLFETDVVLNKNPKMQTRLKADILLTYLAKNYKL